MIREAAALGAAVVVGATAGWLTKPESAVMSAAPPDTSVCTLVSTQGQLADPCTVQITAWQQGFRNALPNMVYFPKWKAGSPGDYTRLKAYAISPQSTPQPTVNSSFGAIIRWSVEQCRIWAPDVSACALP